MQTGTGVVTVAFEDPAGRPLVDAIVSIASAPGEFPDIGMVTDTRGEIVISDPGDGIYDFAVFAGGTPHRVSVRIKPTDTRITTVVT